VAVQRTAQEGYDASATSRGLGLAVEVLASGASESKAAAYPDKVAPVAKAAKKRLRAIPVVVVSVGELDSFLGPESHASEAGQV
jgi:hypothetical protein